MTTPPPSSQPQNGLRVFPDGDVRRRRRTDLETSEWRTRSPAPRAWVWTGWGLGSEHLAEPGKAARGRGKGKGKERGRGRGGVGVGGWQGKEDSVSRPLPGNISPPSIFQPQSFHPTSWIMNQNLFFSTPPPQPSLVFPSKEEQMSRWRRKRRACCGWKHWRLFQQKWAPARALAVALKSRKFHL